MGAFAYNWLEAGQWACLLYCVGLKNYLRSPVDIKFFLTGFVEDAGGGQRRDLDAVGAIVEDEVGVNGVAITLGRVSAVHEPFVAEIAVVGVAPGYVDAVPDSVFKLNHVPGMLVFVGGDVEAGDFASVAEHLEGSGVAVADTEVAVFVQKCTGRCKYRRAGAAVAVGVGYSGGKILVY